MSPTEAMGLSMLLSTHPTTDKKMLRKTLVTITYAAAFTTNQVSILLLI
jgi:hypothetical protein